LTFTAIFIDPLLPPAGLALLALLLLAWRRRGRALAALALAPLVLMSMPIVSMPLLASLDAPEPPQAAPPAGGDAPQAIVILSADIERTAAPGGTDLGPMTLERERAGAALARRTGLPVLVTGGLVGLPPPVGVLMAQSMPADFGVAVRWIEDKSATTWENARFSVPMLHAAGVRRIYLVTHAWHMRRSLLAFQRAGMDAVPVSVRRDPWPLWSLRELTPRVSAWRDSYFALHEWVGLAYYAWRT
jgi:uncharacterized SAM-binding protein YcdF (DUF218 family)